MIVGRCFLALTLAAVLPGQDAGQDAGSNEGAATAPRFVETDMLGFTLWLPDEVPDARQAELDAALRHLQAQLFQVQRVVPRDRLADLRRVPIWVQLDSKTACAAYHPSRRWLLDHDYLPPDGMRSAFEIGNPKAFVRWTLHQPWMVLHELAHGHNHLNLAAGRGYQSAPLERRFREIAATELYRKVLGYRGNSVRHYALTNHMELFAESTEAFFGVNDFYPFVRAELARYDPDTHALLMQIWGDDGARLRAAWQDGPRGPCRPVFDLDGVGRVVREPTGDPMTFTREGFELLFAPEAWRQVGQRVLGVLELRLHDVRRRLPAHALAVLEGIRIHVEEDDPLVEHAAWFGPDLAWRPRTIGIGHARRFDSISDAEPGLFLRLFALAWYDLGLDDEDRAAIAAAFARVQEAGLYDSVLRMDGAEVASTALLGPDEFFATLSAAWLGISSHYPFVRAELMQHDPESRALIERLWSER